MKDAPPSTPGADSFESVLDRSNLTRRQLLIYTGQKLTGVLLYDAVWAIPLKNIDPESFALAFQVLINSCDAMRTVIEEQDGVPWQRVRATVQYAIPQIDLRHSVGAQPVDVWIHERCQSPLNPTLRLFDTALLRTGDDEYTWYLNINHVIADGWAAEVLVRTFFQLYAVARQGRRPDPVPLPSFQEYARCAREKIRQPEYRAAEDYWRAHLATSTDLPSFYGQAFNVRSTSKKRLSIELGIELTAKFKALASRTEVFVKSLDATMANVCAALLFAYAYRTSGCKRLAIGVAVHNRETQEEKQLVGLLMEVVPLVVTVDPASSFVSLVRSVNEDALDARRHRSYSVGNPLRAPLYDMFLNLIRSIPLESGQGPARRIFPGHGETSLSLTVFDAAASDNLRLSVDVRSDLLDRIGSDAMARHFRTLLEGAMTQPERPIAALPLVDETEGQLLTAWNRTSVLRPGDRCVHHMFEAQASCTPGSVAVECGDQHLTYQELNRRANQLAHRLQKLGVGPEVLVGISMLRGLDMIVGLLGILKAGGAYVPLDPAYPRERLTYMIDDAGVALMLTTTDQRESLPASAVQTVCVDAERFADESEQSAACTVGGNNLAYVIYTSGSTGRPKGVMIEHRSVCNYLEWRRAYFPLTAADVLLQTASISFDDSVWEIFEPLSTGARLVLVDGRREQDVSYLGQLIARHAVTAACFVPSLLQAFLDEVGASACRHLRRVTTGGEVLSPELAERFFHRLPGARLYNGYGPTEATVSATFWECRAGGPQKVVPIGRPIDNVRVHVIDHDRQLAPVGAPGELYIGGMGVARGYLNQSQLTAEQFVPDPFGGEPTSMLYRTGDIGRWLPDGNLEFLGRLDHQVKLRGFRIELGEIETALRHHPLLTDAVVTLRQDVPGDKQLVAYVVAAPNAAPSAFDLRGFLGRTLPRYMIPARFVVLDRLARSPSGKIDRSALPVPEARRPALSHAEEGPRTAIEEELAIIWAQVLGVEGLGIHDDFFELGGHSLRAVQLFARIEQTFGRKLALSTLLEGPTIRDMAGALESAASSSPSIVPIQPEGARHPLFLMPSATGDILHWREFARRMAPDQPCYALQPPTGDGYPASFALLTDMAVWCVSQLQRVQPRGPYALAGFSFGGTLAFEVAQQLAAQGEEISLLAIGDARPRTAQPKSIRQTWSTIPHVLRNTGWWMWDDLLRSSAIELGLRARRRARSLVRKLTEATSAAGSRTDLHPEDTWEMDRLSDSARRVINTNLRALHDYMPRRYRGVITLFRARAQSLFSPDYGWDLGWSDLAEGGVHVVEIPGNHDTILRDPHVMILAECLKAQLETARAHAP